jgi:dihydrofolate reductase
MGKIVISTNMTLDGVGEDPDGGEGFALGGWFGRSGGADLEQWAQLVADEAQHAAALLLGRRTDEWFAARWLQRTGPWADRLNGLPKYVVSSTRAAASWSNATIISGDVMPQIAQLRRDIHGDVLVYASYRLSRALLDHDLVDEVRLVVFPVLLGAGERIFAESDHQRALRLVRNRTIGTGLTLLTYAVVH